MGLPQLKTCCFVLDLKTGNIVMGCVNAFFSFVMFSVMIAMACGIEPVKYKEGQLRDLNLEAAITGAYVMSIILVLMFLTKLIFELIFVYGVITERPGIIRTYFVMWIVFIILSMFTFFLNAPHYGAWPIVCEVLYINLNIYGILLSHSYYKELNTREEV